MNQSFSEPNLTGVTTGDHDWAYAMLRSKGNRLKHRLVRLWHGNRRVENYRYVFDPITPGLTACGLEVANVNDLHRYAPQTDVYECWTSGWRPCARCFPEFDLGKWNRIRTLEWRDVTKRGIDASRSWRWIWWLVMQNRKRKTALSDGQVTK